MSLIWSTSLLTVGSIIGRCYGFVLRIILARMLGAEGLGAYQMVLTFFMAVAGPFASALPITVSRVVASHRHEGLDRRGLLLVATGISALGCALAIGTLLTVHQFRPVALLGHMDRVTPWFWLIPAMAFSLISQAARGYYLGINRVMPMIISQHVEQLFEIGWLLALTKLAAFATLAQKIPLVIIGMTLADVINSLYLLIAMRGQKGTGEGGRLQPGIVREIVALGLPFCLSRLVSSASRIIEATLIPLCLVRSGMSGDQALAVYGQVIGLALPMLFFPAMIITSLSSTLIPAVAEAMKQPQLLSRRIRQGVSMGLMVGCGAAILFSTRGSWFGVFLFADQRTGDIMAGLAPVAIFWYLDIVTGNLLRGLGHPLVGMFSDLVSTAVRMGYMFWSVAGGGMAVIQQAILISSLISAAINWAAVVSYSGVAFDWYLWLLSPVLSGAAMAAIVGRPVYALGPVAILIQVVLALIAYVAVWFLLNLHPTRGEIFYVPKLGWRK